MPQVYRSMLCSAYRKISSQCGLVVGNPIRLLALVSSESKYKQAAAFSPNFGELLKVKISNYDCLRPIAFIIFHSKLFSILLAVVVLAQDDFYYLVSCSVTNHSIDVKQILLLVFCSDPDLASSLGESDMYTVIYHLSVYILRLNSSPRDRPQFRCYPRC